MKTMPEIGQLVVVSHEPDATMFRVVDTDPRKHGIATIDADLEKKHPNQIEKWYDVSIFKFPSVGQLKKFTKD